MEKIFKGTRGNQSRMKLWYRDKEVLLNKVFDLPHKKNDKKIKEAITHIADTVKLCASKHFIERSQGQHKN